MTTPETVPEPSGATAQLRPKTSFAGDVSKLVSGTVVAQLLGILASPILTRLYGPEAFGLLALFTSITSILGVIACLRYELAIMLPESDEEAANLLGVSLLFTVLITLLTVPAVWWGGAPLLGLLNASELGSYLWLIPPMVFVSGVFLALNYWNSRTRQFGRLSVARVSNSVTTIGGQLGFGFGGVAGGGTLIGAMVGGKALATAILGGQIWRDDVKLFLHSICWRDMLSLMKYYRKFPQFSMWAGLLNSMSTQIPIFVLSFFFPGSVVGLYALSHRILNMPANLVGNAIGQVFYQRAAIARNTGNLERVLSDTFQRLWLLGIYPFLLLSGAGAQVFSLVFGEEWMDAGLYAQILAPWIFAGFVHSPLSSLFSVLGAQKAGMIYNLSLLVFRVLALLIGGLVGQPLIAIGLFSLTGIIAILSIDAWLFQCADINVRALLRPLLYPFGICVICLSVPFITSWILHIEPTLFVILAIVCAIPYYTVVVRNDEQVLASLRKLLSGVKRS